MAARRLMSVGTAEARSAVLFALKDPGNPAGRLSAVRAVAEELPPDPQFVDALFVLLDPGQPRTVLDAVTIALGNYKTSSDVNARLIQLTSAGRPDLIRLVSIRALGFHVVKAGAGRLVELTADPNPQLASAATDALQTLASIELSSPSDWANWWRTQIDSSNEQFEKEMLLARASRFEREARRGDDAYQELRRSVLASISGARQDQLAEVLNGYLTSPRESVRLLAIGQAAELASTGDLPPSVRVTVRALLSDPRREIRLLAARTIYHTNDPGAFDPIAQQVAIEADSGVKAELANALGRIGNVQAVPILRWLLDDTSDAVVQASAGSLEMFGKPIAESDPTAAADIAFRLRALLDTRAKGPGSVRFRETLLAALVPLKQKSATSMFAQLLTADPRESVAVRRLAAQGLGAIGDPNMADLLVETMSEVGEGNAPVRLECVKSLGSVANAFYYADALYRRMDPKFEPDATIRENAWQVMVKLFPIASRVQLEKWPDKPLIKDDPVKQLLLFQSLAAKSEADRDMETYVFYLEQIGTTQMKLGELAEPADRDQRFAEATASFAKALQVTRETSGPSMRVERYIELTLNATLRSRNYPAAASFTSDLLRDPANLQYQGVVGPQFRLEAERLAQVGSQMDDALALIREALAIRPALSEQYGDQLRQIQASIESRQQEKNQLAVPDVLQSIALR